MLKIPYWKKHSSGLQTLLIQKFDSPIVKINMVFPFGSYEDPIHKEGLINFIGDMMMRGTQTKSREKIEFTLDYLGASLNVYSGHHSLVMEGKVLTKNFKPLLELMKETLTQPQFDTHEIQKLKNEIKSDLLLRLEDDQDLAKHHFFKEIYKGHLYERESIGTPTSIDSITDREVTSTYHSIFSQNGVLIAASGDLEEKIFEKAAKELYDLFKPSTNVVARSPFHSELDGREIVLIDKPELTQTQFFIGHPCVSATDEDLMALDVFVTAFAGGMFQAKYMQEIRVKRGWSYGAYGSLDARRDGGSFYLYTFPKNEDTVDAIDVSLQLFSQAIEGSLLTEDSIQFSKNYLSRSFPFKIDTPEKILSQKIYNKIVGRPEDSLEKYREKVMAVDYKTALAKAQQHLTPSKVKIVMVCTANLFEEKLKERLHPKSITVKKYTDIN